MYHRLGNPERFGAISTALVLCLVLLTGCPGATPVDGGGGNTNGNDNTGANDNFGDPDPGQLVPVEVVVQGQGSVVQVSSGAQVTLTAVPEDGWVFAGWDGIENPDQNPLIINRDDAADLTAVFVASEADSDDDGVPNSTDACDDTPAGENANAAGCSASQLDGDGDGVNDDADQCANTPTGQFVDSLGCALGEPATDSDSDGVPDNLDECPDTDTGAEVDEVGCTMQDEPQDADGDGVVDDDDACLDTPAGEAVSPDGCALSQLDSDGDGITNDLDDCPSTPLRTPVDTAGCLIVTPPPDNGGGDTRPNNDNCSAPIAVTDGTIEFSNVNATTDGIEDTGFCSDVLFDMESDIWFCYTATCDGFATISLCGSDFDTMVAAYLGCACPTTGAMGCDDDTCVISLDARLNGIPVTAGESYLIRVGGFSGLGQEQGAGLLTIACGDEQGTIGAACTADAGDCFAEHEGAGCGNTDCCSQVCLIDPLCCDLEWDDLCAEEAQGFCGLGFPACNTRADSCDVEHDSPGCSDVACCNDICLDDTFCCLLEWDETCADQAALCP